MSHSRSQFAQPQRSFGAARVALGIRRGRVRLTALHQSGAAKAFLPAVHGPVPEVVFLNTAGGLTGGDELAYALDLGPGVDAVATTQTAERGYASPGDAARVTVAISAGDGARIDWLPQETILFDRAALHRRTEIELAGEARCVFAETVVLGRAAMGEVVRRLDLRDARAVRRDGRAVLIEPLRLDDDALAAGRRPAMLGGARAIATVALIARGAEAALEPVRLALGGDGVEAAASAWDGKCVVRVLGADGWPVRRQVARVLEVLRGRPLPRVWQA